MSFFDDNKHYIFHSLIKAMNGISNDQKHKNYDLVKTEWRTRIKNSYDKCVDKIVFYQEVFKALAFYETDYLFTNLFFELNAASIIKALSDKNSFEGIVLSSDLVFDKYYQYVLLRHKVKGKYTIDDELEFLKSNFLSLCISISDIDWKNMDLKGDQHPIINKYGKWLCNNLSGDKSKLISSFLLFTKIWNKLESFSNPFNNVKAILFYSNIISDLENNDSGNRRIQLYDFVSSISTRFSNMFVDVPYIPLIDNKEAPYYKNGYLIKRREFEEIITAAGKLIFISKEKSYFNLFKTLCQNSEPIYIQKVQDALNQKFENYDFSNQDECKQINELKLPAESDFLRNLYNQKFYHFEYA